MSMFPIETDGLRVLDDTELEQLASEINLLNNQLELQVYSALVNAANLGLKLDQAKRSVSSFEEWLANNCPRLKRSQAYNYIRLTKEKPELLNESFQTTGHVLTVSQVFELFSAPEEVKEHVTQRIEDGENVTVAEIKRLKKEASELLERNARLAKANKFIKEQKESVDLSLNEYKQENNTLGQELLDVKDKQQAEIDAEVNAKVETEKVKMQNDVEKLVANVGNDYQSKIDAQTDKISELRNKLAIAEHLEHNESQQQLEALETQIKLANQDLTATQARLKQAESEQAYRGLSKYLIETSKDQGLRLLDLRYEGIEEQATRELLLTAAHDLETLAELLRKAAKSEQVDIEDKN